MCICFVECEFFEPWLSTRVVGSLARVMRSLQCWDHFGCKAGEDGKAVEDGKVVCLHCKQSVGAQWGNILNLFSHLQTNHPKEYELAVCANNKGRSVTSKAALATKPSCS